MAKQYMFIAGGDACGACAALDGTVSDGPLGPQHDNCQCQDVPVDAPDCPNMDVGDIQILTNGPSTTVSAEITVNCCDDSEIGESLEQDLGPMSQDVNEIISEFSEFATSRASEIAQGCPEGIDVWVEDGEEEGLA